MQLVIHSWIIWMEIYLISLANLLQYLLQLLLMNMINKYQSFIH